MKHKTLRLESEATMNDDLLRPTPYWVLRLLKEFEEEDQAQLAELAPEQPLPF